MVPLLGPVWWHLSVSTTVLLELNFFYIFYSYALRTVMHPVLLTALVTIICKFMILLTYRKLLAGIKVIVFVLNNPKKATAHTLWQKKERKKKCLNLHYVCHTERNLCMV
jgi:hypothetical protein